ncbi:hypothetical protein BT96DRAFT_1008790 [Gymnopus androsaceus JB14]|uniref:Uncharacterized protein n=1 Tax=Gymnopus androsaceus JB14 TaxID=1447944 RepID=A0A6A4GEA9_9AGAR|nr:hypothetical protein BT96DRAFT_1008790 [Gymnopus androsaceus JB14]
MLPLKRGVSLSPTPAKNLQTPVKKQRKNAEIVPSSVSGEEDNAWSSDEELVTSQTQTWQTGQGLLSDETTFTFDSPERPKEKALTSSPGLEDCSKTSDNPSTESRSPSPSPEDSDRTLVEPGDSLSEVKPQAVDAASSEDSSDLELEGLEDDQVQYKRRPLLLRRGPDASSPASQYRTHIKNLNADLYNAEGELEAAKMENAELKEENIQLQAKVKHMEIGVAKVRGELLDLLY